MRKIIALFIKCICSKIQILAMCQNIATIGYSVTLSVAEFIGAIFKYNLINNLKVFYYNFIIIFGAHFCLIAERAMKN